MDVLPVPKQEYTIDNVMLEQYLEALRDHGYHSVATSVSTLVEETVVIHYGDFIQLLERAVNWCKSLIGDREYVSVYSAWNKSEYWVKRIVQSIDPDFISAAKDEMLISQIQETTVGPFVIFDDGSFSGIHMIDIVEEILRIVPDAEIHVCMAVTTYTALDNLNTIRHSLLNIHYGIILSNNVGRILSADAIEEVKDFYQLEEGDNDLCDQYPVFFDHKMPGVFSSIPFVYAGLTPWGDEYPLIKGCVKGTYAKCPYVPYRS